MKEKLQRAKMTAYSLLKESGRSSKWNRVVMYVISAMICLNVVMIIIESVMWNGELFSVIGILRETFFVFFFVEYLLRIWIADLVMRDKTHPVRSRIRYLFTFTAIINLLAFLPTMFTLIDFRIFRVLRLLRLMKLKSVKRYTDILAKVIKLKGAQLLAALFIVFIFILASAVIIYDLENKAQPEVFKNVLSGVWWSVAAITTIGYGDMYPITPMGKLLGSFLSIAGVFIMAVPIGILTSGFFEVSKNKTARDKGMM